MADLEETIYGMNVVEIIDMVKSDCEAQSQYLQENQDVKWDVYDHDNWDNMVEWLDRIKRLITMEKHNENKKKTIREYGKEL